MLTRIQLILLSALLLHVPSIGLAVAAAPVLPTEPTDTPFVPKDPPAKKPVVNAVTSVAYSPDGKSYAVGGADFRIFVFKAATGRLVTTLKGHGAPITDLAYDRTGKVLASASRDSTIRLWNPRTGKQLRVLSGHSQAVLSVAFNPNGRRLISGGEDSRALLWNATNGRLIRPIAVLGNFVTAVTYSARGKIAAGTADARIRVWDSDQAKSARTLRGHRGAVVSLSFSPAGDTLASGSADKTIRLWKAATGKQRKVLTGSATKVADVAFTRNGSKLLTGSADGTVRAWNANNGSLAKKVSRPGTAKAKTTIAAVALDPDGGRVVQGGPGALVETLSTATGRIVQSASLPAPVAARATNPAAAQVSAEAAASLADGTGGPVMVVTSTADPFGGYYAEILRAEGLTSFTTADVNTLTAASLQAYDVVILAARPLTATQITVLTDWVNAGGNLIAMRPDPQLAGLLGLTSTGATLNEGYLQVDTSSAAGNGIVGQTMQYHGAADRYTASGASTIATLYSGPSTSTGTPAISLRNVGSSGGQAAAFTYDLARSIVYTRQGNPAWDGQERDGTAPIRSDDLFFGGSQTDWVNLDKVAIPQADEQQRLLVNLITTMAQDRKPMPRFWYLPRGLKAAVVMTGDDHAVGGTGGRFDQFLAASPAGCSVDNWECIRGTSYVFPSTTLTNAQAVAYTNQGFEVGLHPNTSCNDYTAASLRTLYTTQLADWASKFTGLPAPRTSRTHCIAWSDWTSQAVVELEKGIRLDTNYYFWPPSWVQDRPGFMTGSGMPMRFADKTGNLIDVYQAATQLTDESGQSYPRSIDTLLDNALGSTGYYGVFTINAHTDDVNSAEATATVNSAKARGVPVVTARQMLTWLDARNSSSMNVVNWNAGQLTFTVSPAAGATGLRSMVPLTSSAGVITGITRDGAPAPFTTEVVKGITYAFVPAVAGTYVATYAPDTTGPSVTATSPAAGALNVTASTAVSATFNEPLDASSVTGATVELRNPANALVNATVSYDAASKSARLTPSASLTPSTVYRATIKGGTADPTIKDTAGNRLAADVTWTFTTASGPACPCTIWAPSATPVNQTDNDPNAVELGVRFRADLDGFITGVRFWKGPQNTGTHTGNLWTNSGSRMATAVFTGESATGWQQVTFSSPVAVTAGTTYVASYHTTSGMYPGDNNYFASAGVDRAPLHALANGVDGLNGLYAYSSTSVFPSSSWQSSNYWVDVAFSTVAPPDTSPPTVTTTSPLSAATGVPRTTSVSATFSEAVDAATITSATMSLTGPGGTAVPGTVSYDPATRTATLQPSAALTASTAYSATIKGGATDPRVKDLVGNALAASYSWTFTTAAPGACDSPANAIVAENCLAGNPATEWDRSGNEQLHRLDVIATSVDHA